MVRLLAASAYRDGSAWQGYVTCGVPAYEPATLMVIESLNTVFQWEVPAIKVCTAEKRTGAGAATPVMDSFSLKMPGFRRDEGFS